MNLTLNARDAMPNGGELSIRTSTDARTINVEIYDTGSGVDESAANLLFDPFYTTKPTGKGTGLGLAVCYGIISAHDGSIKFESVPSGGTKFVVAVPVLNSK